MMDKATERARPGAIANAAVEVLLERNCCVMWGDIEILYEIAHRAGFRGKNPLHRHRRIFAALDRDGRFDKAIHKGMSWNSRDAWVRIFCLNGNGLEFPHITFGYLEEESRT